jgi:membrane protease YdiL (CAAX protease family)
MTKTTTAASTVVKHVATIALMALSAILLLAVCYAPAFVVGGLTRNNPILLMASVITVSALIACIGMFLLTHTKLFNWRSFGFNLPSWRYAIPIILCAIIVGFLIAFSGMLAGEPIPESVMQVYKKSELLLFCLIVVCASIQEELIFRGLIFGVVARLAPKTNLDEKMQLLLPSIISATLFGLVHLPIGPRTAIAAFVLGLTACYARVMTGSVLIAIACHMIFNVAGFIKLIHNN